MTILSYSLLDNRVHHTLRLIELREGGSFRTRTTRMTGVGRGYMGANFKPYSGKLLSVHAANQSMYGAESLPQCRVFPGGVLKPSKRLFTQLRPGRTVGCSVAVFRYGQMRDRDDALR